MTNTASPTTGATDEQIEAAARLNLARSNAFMSREGEKPNPFTGGYRNFHMKDAQRWANFFVPPGMVIAPAADVLTAEQRAAIGVLVKFFDAHAEYIMHDDRESEEAADLWAKRVQLGAQAMELRPVLARLAARICGCSGGLCDGSCQEAEDLMFERLAGGDGR